MVEHIGPSEEGAEFSDIEKCGQGLSQRPWWGIALGCGCLKILLIVFITTVIVAIVRL